MSPKTWLREPLVGFIALGSLVFVLDRALVSGARQNSVELALDATTGAELAASLERDLGRVPSAEELKVAQNRWLDDEVVYREARALGLDRDDLVVRTHLVSKLRHVVRERVVPEAPSEEERRAVYAANPTKYTRPLAYDLSHVFILNPPNAAGQRADVAQRVAQLTAQLNAGAEPASVGDHFPRGAHFDGLTREQLEAGLELQLESVLRASELKRWQAVVGSRGTHLIRLDQVHGPELAPDVLKAALNNDFIEQKKAAALQTFTQELRKKYPVVVQTVAQ